MKLTPVANIDGAFFIDRENLFRDERGNFMELHRDSWFDWLLPKFVQRNQSYSLPSVLRGMHSQTKEPQGKLITVSKGQICDVIFDARKESPTFGQGFSIELSNFGLSLYVPPGCLHGFYVLSNGAVVTYDCTTYYRPEYDGGVRWDDPNIRQLFPRFITPIVSAKDRKLPSLEKYLEGVES